MGNLMLQEYGKNGEIFDFVGGVVEK